MTARDASKPVRALVHQGGNFFEVSATSAASGPVHPALIVHSASDIPGAGATVMTTDGKSLKTSFTYGKTVDAESAVHITRLEPVNVSAGRGCAYASRDRNVDA